MIRDATAGHVLEGRVGVQLRIEVPFLFTGGRVEREQTLVRRTQIKHIADFNWRHFVGQFTRIVRHLQVAGTEYPGFLQVFNVVRVDLLQRGVTLTFLVTTIRWPVAVSDLRDSRSRRGFCVQRTVDLLWVIKAGPGQNAAGNQQGNNQARHRTAGRHNQATPDERQDQPDTEEDQDVAARRQCPEVEPDFPDAPDHGGKEECGIQPQCGLFSTQQQDGYANHNQTRNRVVPGAAESDQPDATD